MKKLIMTAIMLSVAYGHAQTTNLTFQWHGQTMGLYFEATNLTASVKRAIRDDIAYSMSLIPTTNVVFEVFPPTSPSYSKYTGFVDFHTPRINYCGGVLSLYKTAGGNIHWEIDTNTSTKYLMAIALTNQYATAISAFTNFHHNLVKGFDVSGMTLAEKKAFFWGSLIDEIEQEEGANFEPGITATLSQRPSPLPEWMFPPRPSILAFSKWEMGKIDDLPTPVLLCLAKHWTPENKNTKWPFVYVKGKWRYCLMEF
jgi:hypothetical protein